jgi:hypothetical protein
MKMKMVQEEEKKEASGERWLLPGGEAERERKSIIRRLKFI